MSLLKKIARRLRGECPNCYDVPLEEQLKLVDEYYKHEVCRGSLIKSSLVKVYQKIKYCAECGYERNAGITTETIRKI